MTIRTVLRVVWTEDAVAIVTNDLQRDRVRPSLRWGSKDDIILFLQATTRIGNKATVSVAV